MKSRQNTCSSYLVALKSKFQPDQGTSLELEVSLNQQWIQHIKICEMKLKLLKRKQENQETLPSLCGVQPYPDTKSNQRQYKKRTNIDVKILKIYQIKYNNI
jgi:uncharacterized protein YqcC (DUF446 family)